MAERVSGPTGSKSHKLTIQQSCCDPPQENPAFKLNIAEVRRPRLFRHIFYPHYQRTVCRFEVFRSHAFCAGHVDIGHQSEGCISILPQSSLFMIASGNRRP
ncbi:hypothetical protein VTI74DRAFT_7493 [Chaetomium olivicolor]